LGSLISLEKSIFGLAVVTYEFSQTHFGVSNLISRESSNRNNRAFAVVKLASESHLFPFIFGD